MLIVSRGGGIVCQLLPGDVPLGNRETFFLPRVVWIFGTQNHGPYSKLSTSNPPAVDSAFHVPPVVALAEPDFTAHNPDVPDPCSQCQLAHIDKQKQTGPPQPCPRPLEGEGLAPWHCPPDCPAKGGKSRCDLALCPCCYGLSPQPIPHPSHPLCPPAG